ncbi:MAG: TonB-dependent receptor [Thermodesulfobacteriota bacterium]|jgi:iron complex outermembrane receptor protein
MKNSISIISCLTLSILIPFSLLAQEKEVTLEEVVVTATRDTEEIRKIPASVTVITKEEIEHSNAQTTVDLLRDKAGVVVSDYYGTGKNASVDIRGFGETGLLNTLVLVDGRRVNEIDLSGVDWTQIPLDQVERIEIVRGSGSVLYGDNAVGGVINIITKKPEKPFSANAEVVGGSYGYNKESASVSGKWGPLSAILNASHNSTEGYRENGFLRAEDVGGKLIYDMNENLSFYFNGSFHHDDTGLPGGLPKDIYISHPRATLAPDDHALTDDGYGDLGVKAKLWNLGRIEADLSYRHREVDDFFVSYSFKDQRYISTWGFTPKYILEKSLWNFRNKLILGFDFYNSDSTVDSQTVFFGLTFLNRVEVTKQSIGAYVLDEFSILDNLILSLGYRHEWVTYDLFQETPRAKDKTRDNEPAYSLSINYLFDKKSSAFFSFKRSFRFPVSDELIQYFPTFQVNPMMKPQTGYHYEAGIRHAFTEQIEANLTVFWIDLHDEIFYNPETFSNENFPKTRRQGVEVGAKVKPYPWLSCWANYTYIRPILLEAPFLGNDIPGVPRHKGSLGVDIDFGKGFLLNTKANIVGSRHLISDWGNQFGRLDGYYTLDAKLSYSWKGLKAFAGVNNLTNQKYAEFAVTNAAGTSQLFYPSPGRNFLVGVSYTF